MIALPRDFYERDTVQVARELLGKILVRRSPQGVTAGRIVEVEAYVHEGDAACHAARGRTRSNRAMFGPAGRAYVYPIHSRYCLNAVTRPAGLACAVLIRAVEPLVGMALMASRRGVQRLQDLTRGPGRLCEAFAIDRRLDHWDLTRRRRLWIEDPEVPLGAPLAITAAGRIGIREAQELPYRFFVDGSPFVSGRRRDHRQLPRPVPERLLRGGARTESVRRR